MLPAFLFSASIALLVLRTEPHILVFAMLGMAPTALVWWVMGWQSAVAVATLCIRMESVSSREPLLDLRPLHQKHSLLAITFDGFRVRACFREPARVTFLLGFAALAAAARPI